MDEPIDTWLRSLVSINCRLSASVLAFPLVWFRMVDRRFRFPLLMTVDNPDDRRLDRSGGDSFDETCADDVLGEDEEEVGDEDEGDRVCERCLELRDLVRRR